MTNTNQQRGGRRPPANNTRPATHWRITDDELQALSQHSSTQHVAPASGQNQGHREVYAVVNSEGLLAIYHWKEDAISHAKVCAGTVQTMRVNYELPGWVKVMVDRAADLAAMQNNTKSSNIH